MNIIFGFKFYPHFLQLLFYLYYNFMIKVRIHVFTIQVKVKFGWNKLTCFKVSVAVENLWQIEAKIFIK